MASDYKIEIAPYQGTAKVTWRGKVIVQSKHALVLRETRHNPVIYFPRADADMAVMQRSAHTTHCPHKGDASYFSLVDGDVSAQNAVWSYETPIPAVAAITQHLAFYTKAMGKDFGIDIDAPGV